MNTIRALASALLLTISAAALAAPAPVLIQPDAGHGSERTINLQTSEGAACSTPVVGNCGSCAISCPTGKAATCKPGVAVNVQPGASCVTPPECKCQ